VCARPTLGPDDGRFATLRDVVDHYDALFGLGLASAQKDDLVA